MGSRAKILVFASGTETGGGSGFENLVRHSRGGDLEADIVAVISNHKQGGVWQRAQNLGVPFIHFPLPREAADYRRLVAECGADLVALSGWLKRAEGLDPTRTVNIHPGPLPAFGGAGMYGMKLHAKVLAAFRRGEIAASAISMHFVTAEYDRGPVFFRAEVAIHPDDTTETLAARIHLAERYYQPGILNLVATKRIEWDGLSELPQLTGRDFVSPTQPPLAVEIS